MLSSIGLSLYLPYHDAIVQRQLYYTLAQFCNSADVQFCILG